MNSLKKDKIRQAVRKAYGEIAKADNAGCCWHPSAPCCGTEKAPTAEETSADVGYSSEELSSVPEGTNMGLGCGNPQAIAGLKAGETVVDLGSGGGFDCFLAAHAVGEKGHIFGLYANDENCFYTLTLKDLKHMDDILGDEQSKIWKSLDVSSVDS